MYLKSRGKDEDRPQMGLVAQDVAKVVPEVVLHDKLGVTGMKDVLSVDYERLTALLIEAVKELNTKVDVLQKENKEIKAKLGK
jgi:hypothetical protein